MISNRRRFLVLAAAGIPLAMAGRALASAPPGSATCADAGRLSLSQKNRRRALGFQETAPDAKLACRGCAFFTPGEDKGCGDCAMLDHTVGAGATCTSFTPREG